MYRDVLMPRRPRMGGSGVVRDVLMPRRPFAYVLQRCCKRQGRRVAKAQREIKTKTRPRDPDYAALHPGYPLRGNRGYTIMDGQSEACPSAIAGSEIVVRCVTPIIHPLAG